MTKAAKFMDVHILHSIPFSNLNRDDRGSPKQMVYGGNVRARISSQCIKRATRIWLEENTTLGSALRTRRLPELVRLKLKEEHLFSDEDATQATINAFLAIAVEEVDEGNSGKRLQSKELTFTTTDTAKDLADVIALLRPEILEEDFEKNKKKSSEQTRLKLQAPLNAYNPIIALCGRMLATVPDSYVDGALQIAHAFTTHTSTLEFDYFTAVDDQVQAEARETGAAHIDVGEYVSGVFYRHATVGLEEIYARLDGSTEATSEAVVSFLRAFVIAEPTGKQHSANAHTRPDLVAVVLRSDRPVSFAAAFEKAVQPNDGGGYMQASVDALRKRAEDENRMYGTDDIVGSWHFVSGNKPAYDSLGGSVDGLEPLVHSVQEALVTNQWAGSAT